MDIMPGIAIDAVSVVDAVSAIDAVPVMGILAIISSIIAPISAIDIPFIGIVDVVEPLLSIISWRVPLSGATAWADADPSTGGVRYKVTTRPTRIRIEVKAMGLRKEMNI
jgi:hypothetical protein